MKDAYVDGLYTSFEACHFVPICSESSLVHFSHAVPKKARPCAALGGGIEMMWSPLGNVDQLIDGIYEAAALPELWPDVLKRFASYADCEDAVLIAEKNIHFLKWVVSSQRLADLIIEHAKRPEQNLRTQRLVELQHAGFLRDTDVLSTKEREEDALYKEFLYPQDLGSGVATLIRNPTGENIIFHAERSYRRGAISNDTVQRLDELRPHLARSALLSSRLGLERVVTMTKALELVGLPAAAVNWGGAIVAMNELFDKLLPSLLTVRGGRLGMVQQKADALLEQAFASLRSPALMTGIASIPIRRTSDHPPYILHVVPVVGGARDLFSAAAAVLLLTAVVPSSVPSANVVQGLFDLTPAEAKLAVLIAAGHSPKEAASRLSIATETARTVLKRLFDKTGVRRQAELVALLGGSDLK